MVVPTAAEAAAGLTLMVVRTGTGVTVSMAEPLMPPLEAEMVADPAVSALARPLALTVATAVLSEAQVMVAANGEPNWSNAVAVNCWVLPAMTEAAAGLTVMVVSIGGGVTVRGAEAIRPPAETEMVALPTASALARPLWLTVATAVLFEDQVATAANGAPYWSSIVALNWAVPPTAAEADAGAMLREVSAGTARKLAEIV